MNIHHCCPITLNHVLPRLLVVVAIGFSNLWPADAAVFSVTSNSDSGPGTLRQALIEANSNTTSDVIEFNIAGGGLRTITLLSALPQINEPVTIDGGTQPGYAGLPLIELNGLNAGQSAGLRVVAGNCVLRGLVLNRFEGGGIRLLNQGGNVVQACYLGTGAFGANALANGEFGIWISSGSSGNLIGGTNSTQRNVISGNTKVGVYLQSSPGNILQGNFVGLTSSGTAALSNGSHGVIVDSSSGTVIGGAGPGEGNVISGNLDSGLYLLNSVGARVQGNLIGLTATGGSALGNSADGVRVSGGSQHLLGGGAEGEGNVVGGNGGAGMFLLDCSDCVVRGNRVGTDLTGMAPVGNALAGITMQNATSNVIGGSVGTTRNLISGNTQEGLYLTNSTGNRIEGNWIGLNGNGSSALGNAFNGITLTASSSNSVGGTITGSGNVISGNEFEGVSVRAASTLGNWVQGNRIGTTPDGTAALGNGRAGIGVSDAPATVIGGPTAGAGNLISGNGDAGIFLIGAATRQTLVQGNFIGTSADGNTAISNRYEGIYVEGSATNTIGGTVPGAGNLIAGNYNWGIYLTNTSGNVIQGNRIGTKADGSGALGHRFHAIELAAGASNNRIGGADPGAGNRIAHSLTVYTGVRVRPGAIQNAIRANSIFANGGLGIDLGAAAPTPNDDCDPDTGANQLQNFPVIAKAAASSSSISISGDLNSTAGHMYALDFFASPVADPSGYGEGEVYLGSTLVAIPAGPACSAHFVAGFGNSVPVGWTVSATATDPLGNTSELGLGIHVEPMPSLGIELATPPASVMLAWTNAATGYGVLMTESLTPPVIWLAVTNSPVSSNGQWVVTLPIEGTSVRFYRLGLQ